MDKKKLNNAILGVCGALCVGMSLIGGIKSFAADEVDAQAQITQLGYINPFYSEVYGRDIYLYCSNGVIKEYDSSVEIRNVQYAFVLNYDDANSLLRVKGGYFFDSQLSYQYSNFYLYLYSPTSGNVLGDLPVYVDFYGNRAYEWSVDDWEVNLALFGYVAYSYEDEQDKSAYESAINSAANSGYGVGFSEGYSGGYSNGHSGGYTQGFNDGSDHGLDIWGLIGGVLSMPFTFVQQAFDVTLFEGTAHAFPVGTVIYSFFAIALLIGIIKLILGR